MTPRRFASPAAFKQSLEQRLRASDDSNMIQLRRARRLLVFDRFLARVVDVLGDAVVLKGGIALELRVERARTTKDVDLRMVGAPGDVFAQLQAAARRDLGDFITFEIRPDDDHPEIQNDGMKYDGLRFRAEAKLAGKIYGDPFGVDVVFGEPMFGEPELVTTDDVLAFAGVAPPTLRLYPVETHIAEKLHAYTMPRTRPNSRVKDLPDLALLATTRTIDALHLRRALEQTFAFRATHPVPAALPAPSEGWRKRYEEMAREDQLAWPTLDDVTRAAQAFLDPVLAREHAATWQPATWTWRLSS
ncbi:MAG TPA: nucleotidyl transferase AbiEii/AbiGii toxin family protein [Kofleriaceae bacterium]|nr:nucleotidyl transferase AbiEii/AbiGii toxin family protein [Kofleriaceae bacterium]